MNRGINMAFSKIEKENIKKNCEKHWSKYGYKKTNINDLCQISGISKGSFYNFFDSKEALFYEVIISAHNKLVKITEDGLKKCMTKYDFANFLKLLYQEYTKLDFLNETSQQDFIKFLNKLDVKKQKKLMENVHYDLRNEIRKSNLKYKVDENLGISALGYIFTPLSKEELDIYNENGTIEFLIDITVDRIFE